MGLSDVLGAAPAVALPAFLRAWHGAAEPLESRWVPPGLPPALTLLHQVDHAAPRCFLLAELLPPRALRSEAGKTVFCVEEQAAAEWAVADEHLSLPDPPVWYRGDDPDAEWEPDAPSVTVFALQMAVLNAAITGPHRAVAPWLEPDGARRVTALMAELPLPPSRWPEHPARYYATGEALAVACPNDQGGGEPGRPPRMCVWVAAQTADGLAFLQPHVTGDWDFPA